jgi:hypothetical protein
VVFLVLGPFVTLDVLLFALTFAFDFVLRDFMDSLLTFRLDWGIAALRGTGKERDQKNSWCS